MITNVGSLSLFALMPGYFGSILNTLAELARQAAALEKSINDLVADALGYQDDIAALRTELATITGLIQELKDRVISSVDQIPAAIQRVIKSIESGEYIVYLLQTALAGPQAVIDAITSSIVDLQRKAASIQDRLLQLIRRFNSIEARVAALKAQLAALLGLIDSLKAEIEGSAAAGFHVYAYDGDVGSFGTELQSELSAGLPAGTGPLQHANALVIATAAAASWDTFKQYMKTEPG